MSSSFVPNCLEGRVALITGGGSGIGKGIAKKYMELGCDTVIVSRNLEKLEAASKDLERGTNQRCFPIQADVRNYQQMEAAVDEALKAFGKIDFLVNCAAGNFLCPLEQLSLKGFRTVMEIDAYGTFIASQIVFKKAFKHNGGVITNISMTLHFTGALFQLHAGAAKGAIDSMTKHMAVEWGPYGVRVNGVAPGPIKDTVGVEKLVETDPSTSGLMEKVVPLQRFGSTEEVANTVVFLSLPEASYVTGTTIVVDGGQWLTCCNYTALSPSGMKTWLEGAEKAKMESKAVHNQTRRSRL